MSDPPLETRLCREADSFRSEEDFREPDPESSEPEDFRSTDLPARRSTELVPLNIESLKRRGLDRVLSLLLLPFSL